MIMNLRNLINIEKYYWRITYLTIAIIVSIVIILTTFNRVFENPGQRIDSAAHIAGLLFLAFVFAPWLLDLPKDDFTEETEALLPASIFEKFMHYWLRYYIIIPLTLIFSYVIVLLIMNIDITTAWNILDKELPTLWKTMIMQPILFTSGFIFRSNSKLNSVLTIVIMFAICILVVVFFTWIIPRMGINVDNFLYNPIFHKPLSHKSAMIVSHLWLLYLPYIISLWITSYYFLKEKEL
jgi:hypothetical protein